MRGGQEQSQRKSVVQFNGSFSFIIKLSNVLPGAVVCLESLMSVYSSTDI